MEKAKIVVVVGKGKRGGFCCPLCDGESLLCAITMGDCAIENGKMNFRTPCPLLDTDVVVRMGELKHEDYINTKAD